MESIQLVAQVVQAMAEKKAEDIKVLDIREQTGIADYFVICTGNNTPQTKAIADFVEELVEDNLNLQVLRREGFQTGAWILLDYSDVVVQIFRPEEREYYKLEKLWGDSPLVDIAQFTQS